MRNAIIRLDFYDGKLGFSHKPCDILLFKNFKSG